MVPSAVLVLAVAASTAHAALHEIWWNITYTTANPDASSSPRRVIGINNTWPPPPVEISSADTLRVHARNSLDTPTALHHHGMFFNASGWADGAVGVTQCGIPPGEEFTYEVDVAKWDQWGTYWVHAHNKGQYVDGLRAPFVIHNAAGEVHKYDDEFTVVLGDWYHDQYDDLVADFLSIKNPGGAEPVPDNALIYFTHSGSYLPPLSAPSSSTPGFNTDTALPFSPGKTYRLRIINTSAFAMMFFWIDGHDMRVVEVDGTDTQPYNTTLLAITVAQRYSVLVTARNDTGADVRNWVLHANMDTDMFDTVPDGLNPNATSSIRYDAGAPMADSVDASEYFDVDDTAIVPFVPEPQLPPPDRIIDLNVFFDTFDNGVNRASFNNITYNAPLVPSLLSVATMGNDSVVPQVYGPSAFVLEHGEVFEIRVHNWDAGKHPFHLHGHKFQIVHKSTDVTSPDPAINGGGLTVVEGQPNPIRRDTVQVPTMGNAFLRVRADNPGAWFFHCHIEWHLSAGLAVTFLEAPLQAQQNTQIPSYVSDQCTALSLPARGNAAGHVSTTDLSGLPVGPFPQVLGWRPRAVGALAGCLLTAVLGMASVAWYAMGGGVSEEEMEREAREKLGRKEARRGRVMGVVKGLVGR